MTHDPSEELSEEYLADLPSEKLVELMLHRTNLILAATKSELTASTLEPIKNDLTKIYAALKAREDGQEKP